VTKAPGFEEAGSTGIDQGRWGERSVNEGRGGLVAGSDSTLEESVLWWTVIEDGGKETSKSIVGLREKTREVWSSTEVGLGLYVDDECIRGRLLCGRFGGVFELVDEGTVGMACGVWGITGRLGE
jgi:hypothetical protein